MSVWLITVHPRCARFRASTLCSTTSTVSLALKGALRAARSAPGGRQRQRPTSP